MGGRLATPTCVLVRADVVTGDIGELLRTSTVAWTTRGPNARFRIYATMQTTQGRREKALQMAISGHCLCAVSQAQPGHRAGDRRSPAREEVTAVSALNRVTVESRFARAASHENWPCRGLRSPEALA